MYPKVKLSNQSKNQKPPGQVALKFSSPVTVSPQLNLLPQMPTWGSVLQCPGSAGAQSTALALPSQLPAQLLLHSHSKAYRGGLWQSLLSQVHSGIHGIFRLCVKLLSGMDAVLLPTCTMPTLGHCHCLSPSHCVRGSSDNHVSFAVWSSFPHKGLKSVPFYLENQMHNKCFPFYTVPAACNLTYLEGWERKACKFYAGPGYKVLKFKDCLSNSVKLPQSVSQSVSHTTAWM